MAKDRDNEQQDLDNQPLDENQEELNNQPPLNEEEGSVDEPKKNRRPWNQMFGEDENLKNRQYSRTSRNQPAKEATTLSKVLLLLFVLLLIVPFAIFMIVDAQRSNDEIPARTTEQVNISRSSISSVESSDESETDDSETSESQPASDESDESVNSIGSQEIAESSTPIQPEPQPEPEPEPQPQPQPEPEPQPEATPPPAPAYGTHTVQAGETWYGIARDYGIDVYTLVGMNNATIDTPIYPGMTITVP